MKNIAMGIVGGFWTLAAVQLISVQGEESIVAMALGLFGLVISVLSFTLSLD